MKRWHVRLEAEAARWNEVQSDVRSWTPNGKFDDVEEAPGTGRRKQTWLTGALTRSLQVDVSIPAHACPGDWSRVLRILLVEDNLIIGNALRDHVAADGWVVDWSIDLRSGIHAAARRQYALILLDLHLPDGNGLDLLRYLATRSMPPVIILSAYDQLSDRLEGMRLGAVDYLVKPFNLVEMIARIDRATGQQVPAQRAARSA